jgi:protein gp37
VGAKSDIEWTDASWTPIRAKNLATGKLGWHCEHDTTGCIHCYSEAMNLRLGTGLPFKPGHRKDIEIFLDEKMLQAPFHWKKPRMVFVCSMTDLFAEFMKDEWINEIFAVIRHCPQHTFQVLTKRAERLLHYSRDNRHPESWPLSNVWFGVSCERQEEADERIAFLLQTPAVVRFISAEPLLAPIDLRSIRWPKDHIGFPESDDLSDGRDGLRLINGTKLDWVIVGGESGYDARPMHPEWARNIRDQCAAAGVEFFFKQWGEWWPAAQAQPAEFHGTKHEDDRLVRGGKKIAGRLLDGVEYNGFPKTSMAVKS